MGSSNIKDEHSGREPTLNKTISPGKPWVQGIDKQRRNDEISPTRDVLDPQMQANEQQLSKATVCAKKSPSVLETVLGSKRQAAPRAAKVEESSGDNSPVDQVPLDDGEASAGDNSPHPGVHKVPLSFDDRGTKLVTQPIAEKVPLDEKALHDKKKAEKEHKMTVAARESEL